MFKGQSVHNVDRDKGRYTLVKYADENQRLYDKPLPCLGCGIGWFSFLLGFAFPLMWYYHYATILYFGYYHRDPRERAGLAASTIDVSSTVVFALISQYLTIKFSGCVLSIYIGWFAGNGMYSCAVHSIGGNCAVLASVMKVYKDSFVHSSCVLPSYKPQI
ncbi:uncharacterized protein LOC141689208 isoform X2 [Apium graveolens]